jgi:hypothetical protein
LTPARASENTGDVSKKKRDATRDDGAPAKPEAAAAPAPTPAPAATPTGATTATSASAPGSNPTGSNPPGPAASNPPAPAGRAADGALINGDFLKRARESKGITLKEIAERTKINASSLAAVEDERFEALPDARIYVRGFVRCLAEELGLDADAVARAYLPRWDRWFENQNFPKKKLLRGRP